MGREENANKVNNNQNEIHVKEELSPLEIYVDNSLETKKSKKKKKKCKDNEVSVTCDDNEHSITNNDDSNIDQDGEHSSNKKESMGKEKKQKKRKSDVSNSNILEENSNGVDGSPIFSFELSCGFTNGSTIKKYP